MNNVKVIHLDGQEFSMESGSESEVDINEKQNNAEAGAFAEGGKAAPEPSDSSDDSASDCSSASTASTAQLLASDPLYYILSRLLVTPGGKNLATVLDEINNKLERLMPAKTA